MERVALLLFSTLKNNQILAIPAQLENGSLQPMEKPEATYRLISSTLVKVRGRI